MIVPIKIHIDLLYLVTGQTGTFILIILLDLVGSGKGHHLFALLLFRVKQKNRKKLEYHQE